MHRITIFAILTLLLISATKAAPINVNTARIAATHFLQQKGLMEKGDSLTFYSTDNIGFPASDKPASFYVFNYGTHGFIITGADDRCTPILGYSMNGSYDINRLPDNMRHWLKGYADEIQQGIQANAPANPDYLSLWKDLISGKSDVQLQPKDNSYLLTSTWEQGNGYNNYCPVMDGQHVVVGCVATAMAQIIRYYGAPTRGFGKKSYQHATYGVQAVDFDTTDYDYSLMPDRIRRSSSAAERDMVSRLCYHCGVVVNMNYQNPNHTSGSGAQTSKVPEALLYFGYTEAKHYARSSFDNNAQWRNLIINEIDNRRPIEYSGFSDEGGHAFVLDGYNQSNQYHFNWGWGGYADGFYSLTTMVGFTSQHEMVINIYPSGWDGHLTHFLVSPEGQGDGTSWENSNSNLNAAARLNQLVNRDIWMKEGIYRGDTNAEFAYSFNHAANILGGFAGNETSLSERNPEMHPTIIDGDNRRGLLSIQISNSSRRSASLSHIKLQNGYSASGSCIYLRGDIVTKYLSVHHCQVDSGEAILSLNSGCVAVGTQVHNNTAPVICHLDEGIMRQSLLCNNSGNAVTLSNSARIVNSNIVANQGLGVRFTNKRNSFVNNIVWGNDSCLKIDTELSDTTIRHSAFDSDSIVGDSTCILLSIENNAPNGPRFIDPSSSRGQGSMTDSDNWRLGRGSVCIDAGQRLPECISDGDLDQKLRCRNGHIDLGCYESNHPVAIEPVNHNAAFSLHPNPATHTITVSLAQPSAVNIYDMTGRLVLTRQARSGDTAIDITALPQGVYFLKTATHTAKLIKK